jgi:hypothetical protein
MRIDIGDFIRLPVPRRFKQGGQGKGRTRSQSDPLQRIFGRIFGQR